MFFPPLLEVALNEFAQGTQSNAQVAEWWSSLSKEDQITVMKSLVFFCGMAYPTKEETEHAIENSNLPTSHSLVSLIRDNPRLLEIKAPFLPYPEKRQAFLLLFSLFRVADHRRREKECGSACGHWWHNL